MAAFRFIHLSDFHFCLYPLRRNLRSLHARRLWKQLDNLRTQTHALGLLSLICPSSYDPAVTAAVARFCYDRRNTIDAIIVSGDLATTGKPIDLAPARSFIEDAPTAVGPYISSIAQTLAATRRPVYFLPGNHDMYQDDSGRPGSPHFHLMLEHHMPNRNGAVGWWTRTKPSSGQKIGCVYGDFTLRSIADAQNPLFYQGRGRVYPEILKQMIDKTKDLRGENDHIAIIWLIHFAPFSMCPTELQLVDWQNIVTAAEREGVLCTLCGHTHQQNRVSRDRHVLYCGGSAGSVDPVGESRVHLIEIDTQAPTVTRVNFEYKAPAQSFEFVSRD